MTDEQKRKIMEEEKKIEKLAGDASAIHTQRAQQAHVTSSSSSSSYNYNRESSQGGNKFLTIGDPVTQNTVTQSVNVINKPPSYTTAAYDSSNRQYGSTSREYGRTGQQYGSTGQQYASAGQQYGSTGQQYGSTRQQYGSTGQQYGGQQSNTHQVWVSNRQGGSTNIQSQGGTYVPGQFYFFIIQIH